MSWSIAAMYFREHMAGIRGPTKKTEIICDVEQICSVSIGIILSRHTILICQWDDGYDIHGYMVYYELHHYIPGTSTTALLSK